MENLKWQRLSLSLPTIGAGFLFPRARRRREKNKKKNRVEHGEDSEGSEGSEGGARPRQEGVAAAPVPLSMMRRRLEEIWVSAKANDRLAEVRRWLIDLQRIIVCFCFTQARGVGGDVGGGSDVQVSEQCSSHFAKCFSHTFSCG